MHTLLGVSAGSKLPVSATYTSAWVSWNSRIPESFATVFGSAVVREKGVAWRVLRRVSRFVLFKAQNSGIFDVCDLLWSVCGFM